MYRVREVDGAEQADVLRKLHLRTFGPDEPHGDYNTGYWWIAYLGETPVAYAGCGESVLDDGIGYFSRVGVLPKHRGNGLQRRLMRAFEAKARRVGWQRIVTDTRDRPFSANNIIAAGYKLYSPRHPWAFANSLYWTKDIR